MHAFTASQDIRGWNECLIAYVLAASSPTHPIAPGRLSSRLGEEPHFCERPRLLRHQAAARAGARRAALLRPLFLPRARPARALRPLRRLFCAERRADAHQPGALHRQSRRLQGLRRRLLGPHGKRYVRRLYGAFAAQRPRRHLADRRALLHPLHAGGKHAGAALRFTTCSATGSSANTAFATPSRSTGTGSRIPISRSTRARSSSMIENFRSGLLWRLFMSAPEVQAGLARLGFESRPPVA